MPDFIIYRAASGLKFRARVKKLFKNGTRLVETFFQVGDDGKDIPGFYGGHYYVRANQVVA